jgi:lysophospholipase L1-like esterase
LVTNRERCMAFGFQRLSETVRWGLAGLVLTALPMAACSQSPSGPNEPPRAVPREHEWWKQKDELIRKRIVEAAAVKERPVRLAFVGDSITEGWLTDGVGAWTESFVPKGAVNLGIGGDQTAHVMHRIEKGSLEPVKESLRVVVLMIGTNDLGSEYTPERTAQGVRSCVELLKTAAPGAKILLLAVPPREQKPNELRAKVTKLNELIRPLADGKVVAEAGSAEKRVYFRDHSSLFLEEDGSIPAALMPDFLHLSGVGYSRWAAGIMKDLQEIAPEAMGTAKAAEEEGGAKPGQTDPAKGPEKVPERK